ncbi:MAG TPA: hypothetical protein VGB89_17105 [Bacteroidota bacterium]|jgi:hypothetical protein
MKAITVTALMALVVAIPFFVTKKAQVALIRHSETGNQHAETGNQHDEDLKYDIDDFLT